MNTDNRYHWPHKDLLDVTQLSGEDVRHLLDLAASFQEINRRPVKKVPTLKGKTVVLFFVENSTRTKTSFDVAGKRLSADTYSLAKSGSSLNKGESLKDTALTLQAMNPDVIVIRHSSSGAAQFLAERLHCGVVNAGDGSALMRDPDKAARIAKILHAQALLIAGEPLEDPAAYSELVCTLI